MIKTCKHILKVYLSQITSRPNSKTYKYCLNKATNHNDCHVLCQSTKDWVVVSTTSIKLILNQPVDYSLKLRLIKWDQMPRSNDPLWSNLVTTTAITCFHHNLDDQQRSVSDHLPVTQPFMLRITNKRSFDECCHIHGRTSTELWVSMMIVALALSIKMYSRMLFTWIECSSVDLTCRACLNSTQSKRVAIKGKSTIGKSQRSWVCTQISWPLLIRIINSTTIWTTESKLW